MVKNTKETSHQKLVAWATHNLSELQSLSKGFGMKELPDPSGNRTEVWSINSAASRQCNFRRLKRKVHRAGRGHFRYGQNSGIWANVSRERSTTEDCSLERNCASPAKRVNYQLARSRKTPDQLARDAALDSANIWCQLMKSTFNISTRLTPSRRRPSCWEIPSIHLLSRVLHSISAQRIISGWPHCQVIRDRVGFDPAVRSNQSRRECAPLLTSWASMELLHDEIFVCSLNATSAPRSILFLFLVARGALDNICFKREVPYVADNAYNRTVSPTFNSTRLLICPRPATVGHAIAVGNSVPRAPCLLWPSELTSPLGSGSPITLK
jgi:hypothetical protein